MSVITLTTDFGSGDHEAGVLKGVIWSIAPKAKIADLSHEITRHNVMEAAILLRRAAPYFPSGTVHVVVVDPGVGTSRRCIAARISDQFFVGPDNGFFTLLLDKAEKDDQTSECISLDRPEYWLPEVTSVFHGRDIFSPVAAHLAIGTPLTMLGTPISDPIRLEVPRVQQTQNGWLGQVTHIDQFGNLSTNLDKSQLGMTNNVIITIKEKKIIGLVNTFGERPAGTLIALFDSSGSLAISIVNGSASQYLQATIGDTIEVIFQ